MFPLNIFPRYILKLNFRRVRKIEKTTISHVMSVRPSVSPQAKVRLPRDRFLINLIFEYFSKICRENLSFVET